MNDNPILMSTINTATVAAGDTAEIDIFVAPFDSFIRNIYMTNGETVAAADTNYGTISFQRKGSAGSGTDSIASISSGPALTGTGFVAHVPLNMGALDKSYRYIPKGTSVTYVKEVTGTGHAITTPTFSVEYQKA